MSEVNFSMFNFSLIYHFSLGLISAFFFFLVIIFVASYSVLCMYLPIYISFLFPHQTDTGSLEELKKYIKQEVLKVFEGKTKKSYVARCKC